MMKTAILALSLLAAVAAFPTDDIVPETFPVAARHPVQVLFDAGPQTHRFGNQLAQMMVTGDFDKCTELANDNLGLVKAGIKLDKQFLEEKIDMIGELADTDTSCIGIFNHRWNKFQKSQAAFDKTIEAVKTEEALVTEAQKKLNERVEGANTALRTMETMAGQFGAKAIIVADIEKQKAEPGETAKKRSKAAGTKYFETVLRKLKDDLKQCQEKEVCQIVHLQNEVEGKNGHLKTEREVTIVHGEYVKCAIKGGGILSSKTSFKDCAPPLCQGAGQCRKLGDPACRPVTSPNGKDYKAWPLPKVCAGDGENACSESLDSCAWDGFRSNIDSGDYTMTWNDVAVFEVDDVGTVTTKSQSMDDWETELDCTAMALTHEVKSNDAGTANDLHTKLADKKELWVLGALGKSCDDTCEVSGRVCSATMLNALADKHGEDQINDPRIKSVLAKDGVACVSYHTSGGATAPMRTADASCYATNGGSTCFAHHGSQRRVCACT